MISKFWKLISFCQRKGEFFFSFCAAHNLPGPAAWLLRFYIRLIRKGNNFENGSPAFKVLILAKAGFSEDIMASLGSDTRFDIFHLDRGVIKALAGAFLPSSIDDNTYVTSDPDITARKAAYNVFLRRMWERFQPKKYMDCVLTGNFAYFAERELGDALEQIGIPFVVLHKESMKSPGRKQFWLQVYKERRGPFNGRKILVYNEIERRLQIEAGIARPDRIIVTGIPRLDRLHTARTSRKRTECMKQPQVLFLNILSKTGLPMIARKTEQGRERLGSNLEKLSWSKLIHECRRILLKFAEENPDVRVLVKAKNDKRSIAEIKTVFGNIDLPKNFEIVFGGDIFDYILASDVVCGINSTALLEAIAADVPVIVLRFAEAAEDRMQPYILDLEDAVEYAVSSEDFAGRLKRHTVCRVNHATPELNSGQRMMLEKWAGNSDGHSGKRVSEAIYSIITDIIN